MLKRMTQQMTRQQRRKQRNRRTSRREKTMPVSWWCRVVKSREEKEQTRQMIFGVH
jgi:hypothetical protein